MKTLSSPRRRRRFSLFDSEIGTKWHSQPGLPSHSRKERANITLLGKPLALLTA
jgi:hypothetical protein